MASLLKTGLTAGLKRTEVIWLLATRSVCSLRLTMT